MNQTTDQLLFYACRDFVTVQSEGEWSDDQINDDARRMAEFIEKVRPLRPKLNIEPSVEVAAMLDRVGNEDEAWKVAQLAATLVTTGKTFGFADAVSDARALLAHSRKTITT